MNDRGHVEIELKLRVASQRAAEVEQAVIGSQGSERTHLRATYFDTPARDLAAHGIGWRVRREGRQWVQTLKAKPLDGGDGLGRHEDNVIMRSRTAPIAEASLHEGTPAFDRLAEVLAATDEPVTEQFRTDVWRRTRSVRATGGRVELAFDRGSIASGDRSVDVCELEVELLSGSPHAVIDTARRWSRRYGLWLDTVNKAQRGVLLAEGGTELPLVKAPPPQLAHDMSIDAAVREMVRACLVQVMQNASAVAGGMGGHEHVHQVRLGIRKLRTVLREFGRFTPAVDPTWSERLAETFARLGESRDREVVLSKWAAEIAATGAPPWTAPPSTGDEPSTVLREPAFSSLLLDLLDYVHGAPLPSDRRVDDLVAHRLRRLHQQVIDRSRHFAHASVDQRHDTRKRLKRLRYVAELTVTLFPPKKVRRFTAVLVPALDALGALNDLTVATELYRDMAQTEERAWYAVGWLTAHHGGAIDDCKPSLRAVRKADGYWR